jgi:predicted RNA binding protein YcfA (HicA-like mRNA interferase family)
MSCRKREGRNRASDTRIIKYGVPGIQVKLVEGFGFKLARVSGSHHIFTHPEISELINLQEVKGQIKPYQIRQVLRLVERYNLKLEDEP